MLRKVALFGSGGQLGVELRREFQAGGFDVIPLKRAEVDIADRESVERAVGSLAPDIVVNAAAYNQVDVAETEPQAAFLVNALAVRNLAMACRQADAYFVHFSTDYVFDGAANRPYREEDPTRPLGAYAVSKLAGELYAQAYLEKPLIVRTSGVFGPGGLHTARGNFIELMLRLAAAGQTIRVVADHVASPTYAPLLAARTVELVKRNWRGLIHIGGGSPISWFDYAKLAFEAAGLKPELRPTSEREYRTAARRPKYSALSNSRMESLGLAPFPSLAEAVTAYMKARGAQR
jgi:dTDP-4-dehydrorhamnose reductase